MPSLVRFFSMTLVAFVAFTSAATLATTDTEVVRSRGVNPPPELIVMRNALVDLRNNLKSCANQAPSIKQGPAAIAAITPFFGCVADELHEATTKIQSVTKKGSNKGIADGRQEGRTTHKRASSSGDELLQAIYGLLETLLGPLGVALAELIDGLLTLLATIIDGLAVLLGGEPSLLAYPL